MTLSLPKPTSSLEKVHLLLWKNYLLQKRHYIQTLFDIFLPVVLILIFVKIGDEHISFKPAISPTNFTKTQQIDDFEW